jgi:DNA-binding response OmpR family regulator
MPADTVAMPNLRFGKLELARDSLAQVERSMAPPTTMLIVDYNGGMKPLLRAILEREHYDVIEAGSVYETLHLMRTEPADLVILPTDFLVRQGGWALGEEIWDLGEQTPVILVSQWNEEVVEPPTAGPHVVLARPIRPKQLLEAVAQLLRREGRRVCSAVNE